MFVCSFVRSNGSFATFARVLDTYDSHCGFCALRYLRRRPPPLDFSLSRTVAFAVFFFSKVFCGVELARKRTRSSVMALVPQGCVHGMFLRLLITSYRCFSRFCSDQDLLLRISPEIVAKWASAASGHVHGRLQGHLRRLNLTTSRCTFFLSELRSTAGKPTIAVVPTQKLKFLPFRTSYHRCTTC